MRSLVVILVLCPLIISGQSLASVIEDIEIKEDTVLSVYTWVIENIAYDVRELRSLKRTNSKSRTIKNMTQEEYDEEILQDVIQSKKGVCQGYSLLYSRILNELGFESFVIKGYSKRNNQVNRDLGHAWVAVNINGNWQLHDPTWGAGQVKDGRVFIHSPTMKWYDVNPQEMILTHMPFDPIWQLLETPFRYTDFDKSNSEGKAKSLDYDTAIANHLVLSKEDRRQAEFSRSKSLGRAISLVEEWQKGLILNNNFSDLNSISATMEEVVGTFNVYVKEKNGRFSSDLWTMDYSLGQLQELKRMSNACLANLKRLDTTDKKVKKTVNDFKQKIDELVDRFDTEIKFLKNKR